jgi:hypothetical protein
LHFANERSVGNMVNAAMRIRRTGREGEKSGDGKKQEPHGRISTIAAGRRLPCGDLSQG